MKIFAQVLNVFVALTMAGFVWQDLFGHGYSRYEWYFYLGLATFLYAFIYNIICNKTNITYLAYFLILSNLAMLVAILYPAIKMSMDSRLSSPHTSDMVFFILMTISPTLNIFLGLRQLSKKPESSVPTAN